MFGEFSAASAAAPNSFRQAVNTEHIRLAAAGTALPAAQASAAVNLLGLLDLVEVAARGLASGAQYRVYLAQNNDLPYGVLATLRSLIVDRARK